MQNTASHAGYSIDKKANSFPGIVRFFAHFFSYIFHPIFIPLYVTYYVVFIHPGYFDGISRPGKLWILLRVGYNMVFFPIVTVLLLQGAKFINSIMLRTQRDRIIPYITSNIFFFWMYLVFRNQPEIASILTAFVFSVFISSSIALLANIYFKISMHAIGAGGLIGVMLVILFTNPSSPVTVPLTISILIAGIVCTSRMIASNHAPQDIYFGFFFGLISQAIGALFIL